MKKIISSIIFPITTLVIILLVWFVVAKIVDIELVIPSVSSTFSSLGDLFKTEVFWQSVLGTLKSVLLSFCISFGCAILLAIVSFFVPIINRLMSPIVTIIRAIPTMSVILLTVIWLQSDQTPLLVGFFILFPMQYSGITTAISNIDKQLIEMSKAYNISFVDKVVKLFLPNIAPNILEVMKNSISMNVKIIISAEVLALTANSIGMAMYLSRAHLETAELLAWTLVAISLSFILESMVSLLKFLLVRWKID